MIFPVDLRSIHAELCKMFEIPVLHHHSSSDPPSRPNSNPNSRQQQQQHPSRTSPSSQPNRRSIRFGSNSCPRQYCGWCRSSGDVVISGVILIVAVKKALVLAVVAAAVVPMGLGLIWNCLWERRDLLRYVSTYPDAEFRGTVDGQYIKVTGLMKYLSLTDPTQDMDDEIIKSHKSNSRPNLSSTF